MSKLLLDSLVPKDYDQASFAKIFRAISMQVNLLSEERIAGNYQAQVSVPVSVAAQVGDFIKDSNCTVRGSISPGVASQYVRIGWVCTVPSLTGATWQEVRVATGS